MNPFLRYALLLTVASTTPAEAMDWQHYPGFYGYGHAGIVIGNFDGSGSVEAVVAGYVGYTPELLAVLSIDDGNELAIRQMSVLPARLKGTLVAVPPDGVSDRLAAVWGEGTSSQVVILGGIPLRVLRTINAPRVERVDAVVDVDGDGFLDIVASYGDPWSTYPAILDFESGAIRWIGSTMSSSIGVGQLDGDPALELVLGDTPGRVLDGATHAEEWNYPAGFAGSILMGRFGPDAGVTRFAVAGSSGVQVFRTQPYAPVAFIGAGETSVVSAVRLASDSLDQIAVGTSGAGDISIYDPRTGARIASIPGLARGIAALTVGDLDADGNVEVIFGSGYTGSLDTLRVVDLTTLATDYTQDSEGGPHSALVRGDISAHGSDEVAYLAPYSTYAGAALHVLDAANGKRLRSRSGLLDSWGGGMPLVALAQLDADPQLEIVVAGGVVYDGMVRALDGISLEEQWHLGGYQSIFEHQVVTAVSLLDIELDGMPEVILTTDAGRIVILNGYDGSLVWRSVSLGGSTPPSLAIFRTSSNAPRIAVSRGAALYVFDASSRLLESSAKTLAPVVALGQWADNGACHLGALAQDGYLTTYRCSDLAIERVVPTPAGTNFFRSVDAEGNRFVVAAGTQLHELAANGSSIAISTPSGNQLGYGNNGDLQKDVDGQHVDVLMGSEHMVMRARVALDAIFIQGFDR